MGRLLGCFFLVLLVAAADAQESQLQVPQHVTAGTSISIPTSGRGSAIFYLVGPTAAVKRRVELGSPIQVSPEVVRAAGRYVAILRGGGADASGSFFVQAANPAKLSFLAHPSRVPVAQSDGILGVAFVFDAYENLVFRPENVNFRLAVENENSERTVTTREGVAWVLMPSTKKAGNASFTAAIGDVAEKRVIQEVASDPCNLRMKAERSGKGIVAETEPVRDCSGNPVPDGTVVTFTATDSSGKSTVDAPIKKGIARAELAASKGPATVSVASGVVMGNEVQVGGGE